MNKKYHFTDEILKELKELYPTTRAEDLAKKFNCGVSSIYYHARKLGVKKTDEFIAEASREAVKTNHNFNKHQFKKGQTPFNKGVPQREWMKPPSIEIGKATRFKKGHVPHNHKPIGHERITRDGYVEVKVRDNGYKKNFALKHRLVWEEHNGKIPEGHNVQFRDGNKQNCDINNLYLISRADQMQDNTAIRYPAELRMAMRLSNRLKRKINEINENEQANKH